MNRELTFARAVREATELCMAADPRVYVMGLGVPDPRAIFGTTAGLQSRFGDRRVLDMPVAENGMTGIAIGSAIAGMRPVLTHQRVDFALLSMDQIINNAAKWRDMFGGRMEVPMVIRMMIGRGWGQGPQHSQSLQALFAHIPGLKVVMPATPHDAKGLLISAIEDDGPVIFLEHRWLHGISGPVPEGVYRVPLGQARIARPGGDLTLVGSSYMTLEALRAAESLAHEGVEAEVVDLRTVSPMDTPCILDSVRRTGRLIVADHAWKTGGVAGEVVARVVEGAFPHLKAPPVRVAFPDAQTPTSPALAQDFYPRAFHIANAARRMLGLPPESPVSAAAPLDVPDPTFTGPF